MRIRKHELAIAGVVLVGLLLLIQHQSLIEIMGSVFGDKPPSSAQPTNTWLSQGRLWIKVDKQFDIRSKSVYMVQAILVRSDSNMSRSSWVYNGSLDPGKVCDSMDATLVSEGNEVAVNKSDTSITASVDISNYTPSENRKVYLILIMAGRSQSYLLCEDVTQTLSDELDAERKQLSGAQ